MITVRRTAIYNLRLKISCFLPFQAADGNMKTLRQVLCDMRRGDVLEIIDDGRQDSGFDSGLGSQSLSISRSEGEWKTNDFCMKGKAHVPLSLLF